MYMDQLSKLPTIKRFPKIFPDVAPPFSIIGNNTMQSAPIMPMMMPINFSFSMRSFIKNGDRIATTSGTAVPKILPVFAVVRERPT